MRNRFAATVLIWSLASFGVTAALFAPGKLQATGPADAQPIVPVPTNISNDRIELTLKLADPTENPASIQSGTMPAFKLEAKNKTGVALTIPVKISMSSMNRGPSISRVPPMPKEVWTYQRDVTLAPGQTDSIDLTSDVKPVADSICSMRMTAGDKTAYPFNLVVKSPDAK